MERFRMERFLIGKHQPIFYEMKQEVKSGLIPSLLVRQCKKKINGLLIVELA